MGFPSISLFLLLLHQVVLVFVATLSNGHEFSAKVGVNYGLLGSNLPSPSQSLHLIKTLKAGRVKLYEPNPEILTTLRNTNLQVSIMVPNNLLPNISTNQTLANDWIKSNFLPYHPHTLIRYILVGNEILSYPNDNTTWVHLVPAMKRIKFALRTFCVRKVKVGTPLAMDALSNSTTISTFPPSTASFRPDVADSVIIPLLRFISKTKSFFFVDCYPYFQYTQNYPKIPLSYALFEESSSYTDPFTNLTYTNLLDQMLDSLTYAIRRLGFSDSDVRLFLSETGWPNACDLDEFGANIHNAATYNRNLVKKLTDRPPLGTPARPGVVIPAFVFALFNENQKPGPGTERHWGLFYPNRSSVYPIDLSGGTTHELYYPPLPEGGNDEPYKGKLWCVVVEEAGRNVTALADAVAYACSQGNGTCDAIRPGKECYRKDLVWRANYAFSSYWAKFRSQGATCFFNGLAEQTDKDPSHGTCKYPSVTLS